MRVRLPLYVLLASALTFLVSLYLPWEGTSSAGCDFSQSSCLFDVIDVQSYDGWAPPGQAAAVLAVGLAAAAAVALGSRRLPRHLPLATGAFACVFLALMSAAQLRQFALLAGAYNHFSAHVGYGAYLGIGSAAVALLAACVLRRDELPLRPSAAAAAGTTLTIGVLVALLVPLLHVHVPHVPQGGATGFQFLFVETVPPIFIAGLASFGLLLWTRPTRPGARLAVAVATAVLVGGYLSPLELHWSWEMWLLLACSLALVALGLATRDLPAGRPSVADLTAVASGVLLLASLFLPWEQECGHGSCSTQSGWSLTQGATAGGLAVLLLALVVGASRFSGELAVGVAIFVAAAGSETTRFTHFGYAAPLGFAGTALLLLPLAARLRTIDGRSKRFLAHLVPVLACGAFLAIPVAALTYSLSARLEVESPWRLAFLEMASIVIAARLIGRWLGSPGRDDELVLLPLGLLALTTLDLIYIRNEGIGWQGWASVALCVLLVAFGWIERWGGLERLRLPEAIWRIDRLPDPES